MKLIAMRVANGWKVTVALAACLCLASPASAQTAAEKAIRARQSGYYLMAQQMTRINATVKGEVAFDKAALETSAEALEVIGRIVLDNYPAGSGRGNTKAKPTIWTEARRFKQLAEESQNETIKLKSAVRSGDLDAIKTAYGTTTKACKACHDDFKDR